MSLTKFERCSGRNIGASTRQWEGIVIGSAEKSPAGRDIWPKEDCPAFVMPCIIRSWLDGQLFQVLRTHQVRHPHLSASEGQMTINPRASSAERMMSRRGALGNISAIFFWYIVASSGEGTTKTPKLSGSCSTWEKKVSTAYSTLVESSTITRISLGPAGRSIATSALTSCLQP